MKVADRERWLKDVVSRISGKSAAQTGRYADLQEAVGLDSLGRLEVLAAVEDEFDFTFEDSDLLNEVTLASLLDAIDRKTRMSAGEQA